MDTSISGDRYVAYSNMYHSGPLGDFFEEYSWEKKKTDPHACTHKNDPKRFSDEFATNWRWDLAKSLCLCEIMQKRIPTDTRKSHFPTRGRRETGFVSKEKNLCQIPSATLLQAHKRIKFSHFASMFLRLSCFFPAQLLTLQKRGLKVHSGTIGQIPSKSPPPPPLVHRLLRERWNMIIELSFQKSREKNASIVKNLTWFFWKQHFSVLAPKHVENDGRSHVDRPKVMGFTPYLAGMLKTMIAIGGHHWRLITAYSHVLEP